MDNTNQEEISLYEIYTILKRHIVQISLVTVVLAVVTFAYSTLFIDKQYSTSGTIIVNNRRDEGTNITNEEMNSAKGLATVYSIIIKSDPIMNKVINNLELDISPGTLRSMVSVSSVDGTQVMRVSAKTESPDLSAIIVNEILKIAPDELKETVEAGSVKIISEAVINTSPVSTNSVKSSLLVAILGAFSMSGFYLLLELFDKTVKSEEDIDKYLGYPLLGVIPNVDSVKGGTK